MRAIEEWFESGQPAVIAGQQMWPRPHPSLNVPLEVTQGQAAAYWLDSDDGHWVLKVFLPARRPQRQYVDEIADCIPRLPVLRCGAERRVLASQDLGTAPGTFASPELAAWLEGTVLMPRLLGQAWGDILVGIADGRTRLTLRERIAVARQLVEAIAILEVLDISHRDLSATNVLVELAGERPIFIIDWDSVFHPSLTFQTNATVGTAGYIAPWLDGDGGRSWRPHADRFALAICMAEMLSVRQGTALHGDGTLFDQDQLGRNSMALEATTGALAATSSKLSSLFRTAWGASSFDDCPAASDWLRGLDSVAVGDDAEERTAPRGGAPDYQQWAVVITRARTSVRGGEALDFDSLVGRCPGLEKLLTPGTRWLFDTDQAFANTLAALRHALAGGEDAEVVRNDSAATQVGFDRSALRPSELRQIEQAKARTRALADLSKAIDTSPTNDKAVVDAWWSALRAGTTIPEPLMVAALEAHRRRTTPSPTTIDTLVVSTPETETGRGGSVPHRGERETANADTTSVSQEVVPKQGTQTAGDSAVLTATNMLEVAVTRKNAVEIAAAAKSLRSAGGRVLPAIWDTVATAEARISDLERFRATLQEGDTERTALAWARVATLWPASTTAEEASAGREAFRRWGRLARVADTARTMNREP